MNNLMKINNIKHDFIDEVIENMSKWFQISSQTKHNTQKQRNMQHFLTLSIISCFWNFPQVAGPWSLFFLLIKFLKPAWIFSVAFWTSGSSKSISTSSSSWALDGTIVSTSTFSFETMASSVSIFSLWGWTERSCFDSLPWGVYRGYNELCDNL